MWKPQLTPLTQKRLAKFRRLRRGYISLWILVGTYLLSLVAYLFVGNRPLVISYQGDTYFPAFSDKYYSETLFGGDFDLEAEFRLLKESEAFQQAGGWMVMPIHPYSPLESVKIEGDRPPAKPTWRHPFGTDDRGRDILARLVYGFQISMTFALILTFSSFVLGIIVGAIQGYFGGWIDLTLQRLTEIWAALPFLYVVLLISSIITPSMLWLVAILMLFQWINISYYVRGEFFRERNLDYVTAARSLGASTPRILFRHILGNAMSPIVTLFPFRLVASIFALTSLDFLGFGLPPPTPSWGELFSQGRGQIGAWWLIMAPFGALFATLLLTTFVGESLREAWDPKEYYRREE